MTAVTPTEVPTDFAPSGRPVVRFVAVLMGVAVVFVGMWWSGLFAARVHISVVDGFDRRTNTGIARVTVQNEGALGARVGPLTLWTWPDSNPSFEPPVRVTGQAPARKVRVDAGDVARFTVRYSVDCEGYDRARNSERGALSPGLRLRLHAQGHLGAGRSITHAEIALVGACGDPIDVEGE